MYDTCHWQNENCNSVAFTSLKNWGTPISESVVGVTEDGTYCAAPRWRGWWNPQTIKAGRCGGEERPHLQDKRLYLRLFCTYGLSEDQSKPIFEATVTTQGCQIWPYPCEWLFHWYHFPNHWCCQFLSCLRWSTATIFPTSPSTLSSLHTPLTCRGSSPTTPLGWRGTTSMQGGLWIFQYYRPHSRKTANYRPIFSFFNCSCLSCKILCYYNWDG